MALAAIALAFAATGVGSANAAPLAPFGNPCSVENGVRFCPAATPEMRVPSFDGVPIDVDVTLPESGRGPFPAIVMLHAFGGTKRAFEETSPLGEDPGTAGKGAQRYHYNNNFFARRGYAVLNLTARGVGGSCGGGAGVPHPGPCVPGFARLDDMRYDVRDPQHLLGLLADEGIVSPRKIGATGMSYGASASMMLGFLRDKIRRPDGSLAPWRSPAGKRMEVAAAWPRWGWSDFLDTLAPNGRFRDTEKVAPKWQSLEPFGVPRQSFSVGLGNPDGYYCGMAAESTPCPDWEADVPAILDHVRLSPPLTPEAEITFRSLYRYHGAYSLLFAKGASKPAPLLIQNGFTDGILPVAQGLRVYRALRSKYPGFPVSLQFGDLGHTRGSNKPRVHHYFNDQGAHFFAKYLLGARRGPKPGAATAFTQTCPISAPDGGPFSANSWAGLRHGAFRLRSKVPQAFDWTGGDFKLAESLDPLFGGTDGCRTVPANRERNSAYYYRPVREGFTMIGLPTVTARIASSGANGQIDARLWDVAPDGTQLLVTRGVYRLTDGQSGEVSFQLFGNGYRFAPGHVLALQLLGADAPYLAASRTPFGVEVRELELSVPTTRPRPR